MTVTAAPSARCVRLRLVVGLELAEVFAEFILGGRATGEVWKDGRVVGVGRAWLGRGGEWVCRTRTSAAIAFGCRYFVSRRGDANP
jgi:hypothetical protein